MLVPQQDAGYEQGADHADDLEQRAVPAGDPTGAGHAAGEREAAPAAAAAEGDTHNVLCRFDLTTNS